MLETTHAFAIGGPPNSGKTFTILTAPKPVAVIYCDRPGGDIDLRDLEDIGIHLYKVDPNNFRESVRQQISKVRNDIGPRKLKTAILDSASMGQTMQIQKQSGNNRASMNIKSYGNVSMNMMDVLDDLFSLQGVHRGVTFHIKEEAIVNDKKERIGTIWKPMVMPGVAKLLTNYCALIGYTWKRARADGKGNNYGTCFLEEMRGKVGTMKFDCAKSPEGWGYSEPSDISAWFKRIEDDTKARKELIRAAALQGVQAPPEDALKSTNETTEPADNDNPEDDL
jgi:putative hemolysin